MATEKTLQCSQCGSTNSVDVRFAACVATSQWNKNNYPAPNTTVTTNDDLRLWTIALCRECTPKSYRVFLQNRLKKVGFQLGICSFLFIVAVLAIYFKIPGPSTNFLVEPLRWLVAAAMTFAIFAGVIGIPITLVMLTVNYSRLNALKRSGVVPAKRIDKSFVGEGQRIIKSLAPPRGATPGKVFGQFFLPEHKTLEQIDASPEEKKKLGGATRERDIVAVGESMEELEKSLPSQWKELWERRKENTPKQEIIQ